ncbi:MAG: ribosome maturation factor RimM [Candidatus Aminicenantia bacterium]
MITIGQIVSLQGNKGEVKVRVYSEETQNLTRFKTVQLESRGKEETKEIEGIRPGRNCIIVKFKGVDTRDQAYELIGSQIKRGEEHFHPLEKNTYYIFQLISCSVWDKKDSYVGKVKDVLSIGENELLVIEGEKEEILIPFVKSICLEVILKEKKIIIDPPDGLLNLNEI